MGNHVNWRYWLKACKGVSKMDWWCIWCCPADRQEGRIMKHNASWVWASCRIIPNDTKKQVNTLLGATRSSPWPLTCMGLRLERSVCDAAGLGEGLGPVCLSLAQACSSQLGFSVQPIYYLSHLLKVISEPSGPVPDDQRKGPPERPGRLTGWWQATDKPNGHTLWSC